MAMKTEGGIEYPATAYAYVPDAEAPSTWKLRLWETPQSKITARQVGRAIAALGSGFRGNKVEIPSDDLAGVKRKVLAAWRSVHESGDEVPGILKSNTKEDGSIMTIEEVTGKLDQLDGLLTTTTKRAERAEAVIKLSAAERAVFDTLSAENQDKFLSSPETRKSMMPVIVTDDTPDDDDEIQKKLDDLAKRLAAAEARAESSESRVAAAESVAKAEKEARLITVFEKRAETEFPMLPGEVAKKGKLLKALHDQLDEATLADTLEMFKSGNACLTQLGTAVGKGGGEDLGNGDAWGRIEKKAEIIAKERKITKAKAVDVVITENPEMYNEYLKTR